MTKPMSAAEKQRRYRERLKSQRPEKFEEQRKKSLERIKSKYEYKKISEMTETEKVAIRNRWREEKRKQKLKKYVLQLGLKGSKESCQVPDSIATQPSSQSNLSNIPSAEESRVESKPIEATSNEEDTLHIPSPSHSDVPEPEPEAEVFYWPKSNPKCIGMFDPLDDVQSDKDDQIHLAVKPKRELSTLKQIETKVPDVSIKGDNDEENYIRENQKEYSCDHCKGDIIGYTCVQCENFDLCGACESRLVHPHHYMLRVPRPRPFNEIKRVIAAIRIKIAALEVSLRHNSADDWFDVIIKKEENPFEPEPAISTISPATEDDAVPNANIPQEVAAKQNLIKATSSFPTNNVDIESVTGGTEEVLEEYLDETWLDESILENIEVHRKDNTRKIIVNKRKRGRTRTKIAQ